MENPSIGCDKNLSSLLGMAIGENVAINRETKIKNESEGFVFGVHSQLSIFTAEGLLRATHRAKMHGTNGTFAEIVYESYKRWLNVALYSENQSVPLNDGWLIKEKVFYNKTILLKHVAEVLKQDKSGDLDSPINNYSDAEVLPSMVSVGLFFKEDYKLAFKVAQEICALTHGDLITCYCCSVYASLISSLLNGFTLKSSILRSLNLLNDNIYSELVRKDLLQVLKYYETNKSSLPSGEYLVQSFASVLPSPNSSLYVFSISLLISLFYKNNFEEGIIVCSGILLNDDFACSAIVGSILGMINGSLSVPQKWNLAKNAYSVLEEISRDIDTGIFGIEVYATNKDWACKYPGY
ncbi:MAG: ADP-ribosylglycohydrolase family protein [Bacteroidales bacterium]|nr:ADP-ribosylglycohydrolase family protein [Bacteroidales bacterium]